MNIEPVISVQFVGFTDLEELLEAVEITKAQNIDSMELNVFNEKGLISEDEISLFCEEHGVNLCTEINGPFGLFCAKGKYVAIYHRGYKWNKGKLSTQINVMDKNKECNLVFHDVEILKEDGYPVDQSLRNKFIKSLGFEESRYTIDHLLNLYECGFFGTWLFRNKMLNDNKGLECFSYGVEPKIALLASVIAGAYALNLYDDRFVSCQIDDDAYQSKLYPKYNEDDVAKKLKEAESLSTMLSELYGIETDCGYIKLHVVNGAFNYFVNNKITAESVDEFIKVFESVHKEEYHRINPKSSEKDFFYFIRKKMRLFIVENGDSNIIPMLDCLNGVSSDTWVWSICNCKDPIVKKAMTEHFITENKNALELIEEYKRKATKEKSVVGKAILKIKKVPRYLRRKCKFTVRRFILWRMRKKGYSDYMSREWFDTVLKNLLYDKSTPLKTKLWCYKRGFMPWRIHQYGLTEDNFRENLSDRDYMYLHQINNSYKKWIEDKMTFRLVLEPFKQHLPKYYYQIIQRDDKQLIIRLPDCPDGYETTFDELLRLLRDKGKLALKAASGTHGVGFYKMHYEEGKYYLNNKETSEVGIMKVINSFKSFYIVTEYINMHDDIKNIYAGSVNTIRIMMLNRDGHHPQLMDAYMRIGSKKSGVTDNVAFGGVVCTVDLETGEYGNAMQIKDHIFINIDKHPDTGTPLEGVIPNWEIIKKGLIDISQYMGQLEYLGFDVVCTPEGFVLLEVNSHQDLHRLRYYDQRVKDFFFYKLRRKERRYKINRKY